MYNLVLFSFVNTSHALADVLRSSAQSLEAAVKVISHLDGLSYYVSLTKRVHGSLSRVVAAGNSARVELMVQSTLHRGDFVLPSLCRGMEAPNLVDV